MLQTASYPPELPEKWDTEKYPFYLELFGETQPLIDVKYAEVLPAGSADEVPQNVASVPIYQYWWTIGHAEDLYVAEDSPLQRLFSHEQSGHDESAIGLTVSLYFPVSGGWRIKELLPTLRDLKPFHEQLSMWQEASHIWNDVAPILTGVAALPARMINPLASIPLALLPSFSKLHINTVQPDKDAWSVDKVSCQSQYGLMQGVRWHIPKKLFHKLSGRLTGSLAVCFIPSQVQHSMEDIQRKEVFLSKPLLVRAVLNQSHHSPFYLPSKSEFVELHIAPYSHEKGLLKWKQNSSPPTEPKKKP